jgi:hypothetical protein
MLQVNAFFAWRLQTFRSPLPVPSIIVQVLSAACCLLSAVCCLLSAVCCLLSAVCCVLFAVCCLLSAVYRLQTVPARAIMKNVCVCMCSYVCTSPEQ